MSNLRLLRLGVSLVLLVLLAGLAPVAGASPDTGFLTGCTGEYFNNTTIAGSPSLTRTDSVLNFFWPEGSSPGYGIGVDNYSVRWTCPLNVATDQTVTFNMLTDDGMNLLVDGNLVIWAWYDQGPQSYSGSIYLTAGYHTVRVEYYNHTLGGTAQVSSSVSTGVGPTSYPDWKGEYYANANLSGSPTFTRNDPSINFDWGAGSPGAGIPADYFSVRWTRTFGFTGGTWRFTTYTDDGVRLWVDGTLVLDKWIPQAPTTYVVDVPLSAGNHTVVMEYFENTVNALAQLSYAPVSGGGGTGTWYGQYYNNTALANPPVMTRYDSAIAFDWGTGSPGGGVNADSFSVKWDSVQTVGWAGTYTVVAASDDGIRVWVDGVLVVNAWYPHSATTFTGNVSLAAGSHNVHVEYFEDTGYASVSVQLVPAGGGTLPPPPPPPPSGEVTVDDGGAGWQAGGFAGYWHTAYTGIGGRATWTYNNTFALPLYNWARWFPSLPGARNYEVFAYIPAGVGNTTNAKYWVYHNGAYSLAARNQGLYANTWVSLGTYYFSGLGGENVSLADVTGECYTCRTLVWDAVKFSPR